MKKTKKKSEVVEMAQMSINADNENKTDVKNGEEARSKKDIREKNTEMQKSANDPVIIESMDAQQFSWSVALVGEMIDTGKIDLDILVQRGSVWNHKKDSLLIVSVLTLTPIQNCYMNKVDGVYGVVDGKQRLTAIHTFIKGKYKLHKSTPPIKVNEKIFTLAGYDFESLPSEIQTRLKNYPIRGDWFDNLPSEKEVEFFVLTNSGKPVSPAEISRSRIKSKKTFVRIADHKVMMIAINEANKKKRKNIDILTQLWSLCYGNVSSLMQTEIGPILASTDVSEEQEKNMMQILDYAFDYYIDISKDTKRLTKMQKPTHILTVFYMAYLAKEADMQREEFVNRVKGLFSGEGYAVTDNENYNQSVRVGSSKSDQIRLRLDELHKIMN